MKQQLLIIGCMLVAFIGVTQTNETKIEDNLIFEGNKLVKFVSKNDSEDNENLEEKSKEQSIRKLEQ